MIENKILSLIEALFFAKALLLFIFFVLTPGIKWSLFVWGMLDMGIWLLLVWINVELRLREVVRK